ncbi:uncharacterized protein K460DRAFT_357310 [Cucurbitaria berberidis CBS 394.84]|uniref:Extracellular membrane protein CFEM domain-containing protein n=1 Tax=Cucurbitaria berberidis CBS 394.84 TaxID=1168544 RepID=A0A9P4L6S8_9PLEO|nr:uncharacterized protein K460DRAFT_357310 [Cucurbitaria berberidis CBS 394.84]KAF1843604.1 hypothetical protein K460DRAFT_357310 [Cucurbitaria berberidis CBS 394.84]
MWLGAGGNESSCAAQNLAVLCVCDRGSRSSGSQRAVREASSLCSCLTSAFATCNCKILDFKCACTCRTFRSFSESCTDTSCSSMPPKPLLDNIDGTCKVSSIVTSRSSSSISATSTSITSSLVTTESSMTMTITILTVATSSDPLRTTDLNRSWGAGITDTIESEGPSETAVRGDPSISPGDPNIFDKTRGPGFTLSASNLSIHTTTMSRSIQSYRYPFSNGTGRIWNGSATCTSYSGPEYTAGVASGTVQRSALITVGLLFLLAMVLIFTTGVRVRCAVFESGRSHDTLHKESDPNNTKGTIRTIICDGRSVIMS